ncbi:MAG: ABC-F family ATP-binding cassette domain-containing protein [Bacteriovoracaceae bacterium]|nr:ABC-F family ATP-binding cassette domain-containing protein [Bacteriovoracaceae bacterium]
MLEEPDLLLLDEPTNHLDLETILWLEDFLKNLDIPYIFVGHDRAFINNCANTIFELSSGVINRFSGNYDDYLNELKVAYESQMMKYLRQQKKIKQLENVFRQRHAMAMKMENFKAPRSVKNNGGICKRDMFGVSRGGKNEQSMMKSAMATKTRLERLKTKSNIKKPILDKRHLVMFSKQELKNRFVLKVENLSKSFSNKSILKNIHFSLARGKKMAICGPNGSGKSTLLKIITGNMAMDQGHIFFPPQVSIGYYCQELENLHLANTAIEEVIDGKYRQRESAYRALANLKLNMELLHKQIGSLSFGEKAKVALAKILIANPNILVLDEPTNHLEIKSKEALQKALVEFTGAIIIVSHDRYFQSKVVDYKYEMEGIMQIR